MGGKKTLTSSKPAADLFSIVLQLAKTILPDGRSFYQLVDFTKKKNNTSFDFHYKIIKIYQKFYFPYYYYCHLPLVYRQKRAVKF